MMMTRPRTELLLILLLVSRCSPDVIPDLDLVEETLSDLGDLESLGRDFSQIYTGWVNSSFIYPYYLKVRSHTFSGSVRSSRSHYLHTSAYFDGQTARSLYKRFLHFT